MRISVITPVFNNVKYIGACIECVMQQNCPDAEHVIVDGGSTDGTIEIIKKFADKYKNIRWISEPDEGQSDAMNKGIKMAKGSIIGFLNADDFYEKDVLNRAISIFKTIPKNSFIVGNCKMFDDHNKLIYTNKPKGLTLYNVLSGITKYDPPINPSAYFYSKSIHSLIGDYNINDSYTMDIDFVIRYLKIGNIKYYDEHWGNFRFIEGAKTFEDFKNKNAEKRYKALLEKYYQEINIFKKIQVVSIKSREQIFSLFLRLLNKIKKTFKG